jgi:aldose 1-epimerase
LAVTVTYTLTNDNSLKLDYDAVPDRDTIVSMTNHSYFNLAGEGTGTICDHVLTMDAEYFTPVSVERVTTGELRRVTGTPMDFTCPTPIGDSIQANDEQLQYGDTYDHNWVLNSRPDAPAKVIELYHPASGRCMQIHTNAPGVQFNAGNKLGASVPLIGKSGKTYPKHGGMCLETQHFPNAVNHPHFPSPIIRAGEHYHQMTTWVFSTR